jgi:hypothetical protein
MMQEIASTPFYSIHIDKTKNRLFIVYKGSWMKEAQVPNFAEDHASAVRQLSPGFTALVDVRPMEAMFLTDLIEEVQKEGMRAGIRKAARVYDRPTFIQIQAEWIHNRTGMNSREFDNMTDAESWLNEP